MRKDVLTLITCSYIMTGAINLWGMEKIDYAQLYAENPELYEMERKKEENSRWDGVSKDLRSKLEIEWKEKARSGNATAIKKFLEKPEITPQIKHALIEAPIMTGKYDCRVTALMYAAYQGAGYLNMLNALIKEGADVDARDSDGRTALHYAAECLYIPMSEALVKAGADINAQKYDTRRTPLMNAIVKIDTQVVAMLIAHGANRDLKGRYGSKDINAISMAYNMSKRAENSLYEVSEYNIIVALLDPKFPFVYNRLSPDEQFKFLDLEKTYPDPTKKIDFALLIARALEKSGKGCPLCGEKKGRFLFLQKFSYDDTIHCVHEKCAQDKWDKTPKACPVCGNAVGEDFLNNALRFDMPPAEQEVKVPQQQSSDRPQQAKPKAPSKKAPKRPVKK